MLLKPRIYNNANNISTGDVLGALRLDTETSKQTDDNTVRDKQVALCIEDVTDHLAETSSAAEMVVDRVEEEHSLFSLLLMLYVVILYSVCIFALEKYHQCCESSEPASSQKAHSPLDDDNDEWEIARRQRYLSRILSSLAEERNAERQLNREWYYKISTMPAPDQTNEVNFKNPFNKIRIWFKQKFKKSN